MQTNKGPRVLRRPFRQTVKNIKPYSWLHLRKQDKRSSFSDVGLGPYCTFDSSFLTGVDKFYASSSPLSSSCHGSPIFVPEPETFLSDFFTDSIENVSSSPVGSYKTNGSDDLRHKLRELEAAMLGPDLGDIKNCDPPFRGKSDHITLDSEQQEELMELISSGNLKQVLVECAKAISDDDLTLAEWLISELRAMVSVSGEPIQRLGAYMLEGLVARLSCSGSSIYKALNCKEPTSNELFSYMHVLYEVCPYFKFGYMSANGAIAEAMKYENKIHIIDFQIGQGSQWISLLHALAARPGGAPQVRLTGIDDPASEFARGGGLDIVGDRLSTLAKHCKLPFVFQSATLVGSEVNLQNPILQAGEALAVNFPYMLHHVPDESVGPENHRDSLLRLVKSWSPKVVTLVEQESNTNTSPFVPRFIETFDFYFAIFESISVALPRDDKKRINVEQHCLARDIVNIIACEGAERVERHEVLGKWRSRFTMAGFSSYPLSPLVNATINTLLQTYHSGYGLEDKDGTLYLGWMSRVLVSSCAWQ